MPERLPLSIVMPVYNEEDRLPPTIEILRAWKNQQTVFDIEVIIVDDGSVDKTRELVQALVAKDPSVRLIEKEHVGYMNATIAGFNAAKHDWVGTMEADAATHPKEYERLARHFSGNDVVIGSRILRGDLPPIAGKGPVRRFFSFCMSRLFFLLFRCSVYDPQSGFKTFRRDAIKKIVPLLCLPHDGLRSAEVIVKAYGLGYAIKEVPVPYNHHPDSRCVPASNPYTVAAGALVALFTLWVQSYREHVRKILPRQAVRGAWLARIFA